MSGPGYLGIDLGTSAVKVLVHDEEGRVLARTSRAYPTHAPRPGWSEQSPDRWWIAVCAATRQARDEAGVAIASVGLSGQLNSFVLLDANMRPLADAVIWLDLRAETEARALADKVDFQEVSGNDLSAICVLSKLAWFRAHRPELLAKTRRIALAKDYILLQLTGELATDPSDAQSSAMTARGGTQWSTELCDLVSISPTLLPAIRTASAVAGRVHANAAEATGIRQGTPVATGAGDVAALAIGCGIVSPGRTAITLGTAGHVVAEATAARPKTRRNLWQIPHGIAGRDLWLGLVMSGGLSLSWIRDILGHDRPPDFGALDCLAYEVAPGCEGATFLPFLEGAATPYGVPDARGVFFGLSSAHGTGHLVRAVMEGVAFNTRECIEALHSAGSSHQDLRLAEGGAQSALWCQIIADVVAQPIQLIAERDTSAAGAAILGRVALGNANIAEIAELTVKTERIFEPDTSRCEGLESAYTRYRAMCIRLFKD